MNSLIRVRTPALLAGIILVGFHFPLEVSGQGFSRVGMFESYVGGQYQSGVSSMMVTAPVQLDLKNTGLLTVGFGYHFHQHFSANMNFAFGTTQMTLDGPLPDDTTRQDAYLFNGNANIDYNILKGALTPIITAGVGWNSFETRIPGAPPDYICYPGFPYWWCTYGYPTYSTWEFSANIGIGFRWNVNENLFIKGLAGTTFTQLTDTKDAFEFIQGTLAIGWTF